MRVLSLGSPTSPAAQKELTALFSAGFKLSSPPDEQSESRNSILEWVRQNNGSSEEGPFEAAVLWANSLGKIVPFDASFISVFLPPYAPKAAFKVIIGPGAGYDKVPISLLNEQKIFYSNTPESVAEPTAAHAVILVLTALRGTTAAERSLRRGEWVPGGSSIANKTMGRTQVGLRLGIIGMGSIGRKVATYLAAMGMSVSYHNRKQLASEDEAGATYVSSLEELLCNTDVLSVHVPLTESTRGLIGAKELAMMPRDSVIINTSRGPVIDESALVDALKSGHIASAGLDVFDVETSEGVHPWLRESDQVTLTPHFACSIKERDPTVELEQLMNLKAWAKEGKPLNAVNGGW